jgi:hypothetical protein
MAEKVVMPRLDHEFGFDPGIIERTDRVHDLLDRIRWALDQALAITEARTTAVE